MSGPARDLLIVLSFIWASLSPGEIVPETPLPAISPDFQGSYVVPNERRPQDARPVLEKASHGIYVAVGTERGFIGAALANADRLVLLDRDPQVVLFNRINAALLRISRDREDYLHLRRSATEAEWKERIASLPVDSADRAILAGTQYWRWWKNQASQWKWWRNNVRHGPGFSLNGDPWGFRSLHRGESEDHEFEDANYLYDEVLFSRLQRLARQRRIESHLLSLSSGESTQKLVAAIRTAAPNERISVLDLSNTWNDAYLRSHGVAAVIETFGSCMTGDSMVLLTQSRIKEGFAYHAMTYRYLTSKGSGRKALSRKISLVYAIAIAASDKTGSCRLYLHELDTD
jgi:hypothetical protein